MLREPNRTKRRCKHFEGVKWIGDGDVSDAGVVNCKAFPEGIPYEIAYGDNKHLKKHPDQKNDIVFEK